MMGMMLLLVAANEQLDSSVRPLPQAKFVIFGNRAVFTMQDYADCRELCALREQC